MKKKKLWVVLVCVILVAACAICFWDTIAVHLAPKLVLSKSLGEIFGALDARFEGSPVPVLADALDRQGRQQIQFQLDTSNDLMGIVRYDMNILTQGAPARVQADGAVTTGGRKLDLSLYFDGEFGAVSSGELTQGKYFGITYATFPEDIRSNTFLSLLLGKDTLNQWDTSVSGLAAAMSRRYTLPEFTPEDIRAAVYGVMALKPSVATGEMVLSGQVQKVHSVTFQASGEELAAAAGPHADGLSPELRQLLDTLQQEPNASLKAVFHLVKDQIFRLEATLDLDGRRVSINADVGMAPEEEPVTCSVSIQEEGSVSQWIATAQTGAGEDSYRERLNITTLSNNIRKDTVLEYSWDSDTGDMNLTVLKEGNKYNLRLNLTPTEDGFTLKTNDYYALAELFTGKHREQAGICTMTVSKGSGVAAVQYQNFTQWSMEDMLTLLSGLGGLLGLRLS